MSIGAVLILPVFAALVVLFCYATARPKATVAFFVLLMTSSTAVAIVGAVMLADRETIWQGVVLTCFGLHLLLATMVACLLLCRKRDGEADPCRYRLGTCENCGYDLTGNVSGTCPECGAVTSDPTTGQSSTDAQD